MRRFWIVNSNFEGVHQKFLAHSKTLFSTFPEAEKSILKMVPGPSQNTKFVDATNPASWEWAAPPVLTILSVFPAEPEGPSKNSSTARWRPPIA